MGCDPTSPITPARVNALILPCGKLKQSKFFEFVGRITKEPSIRLGDISPDASSSSTNFYPLAFPNGKILFNFTISTPNSHHMSFSPFELFRQPMLVLCVADGGELTQLRRRPSDSENGDTEVLRSMLERDFQSARDQHPSAIAIQPVIFDVDPSLEDPIYVNGAIIVPPVSQSRSTTMKTAMCDISSAFLTKMSIMAYKIQKMNSINTPSGLSRNSLMSEISRTEGRSLSDTGSNSSWPDARASKDDTTRSTTSIDGISPDVPRGSTSDITTGTKSEDAHPSVKHDRESLSTVATSDMPNAKTKLRQGIILGTLFLHSGMWPDSLRELIENTRKAKESRDYRWFARGLESILIAMLCLASIGSQFAIPSICFASAEKNSSAKHTPSSSNSAPIEIRTPTDSDNHETIQKLSSAIPEITRIIVSNYTRPEDHTGNEIPTLIISDCIIRLGRLLAILQQNAGVLTRKSLGLIMSTRPKYSVVQSSIRNNSNGNFKREMSYLLCRAMPLTLEVTDDTIMDAIILMSRIGSVLGHLGLRRKQALVYKEMVSLLTPAFINSRKRGAAELGIHPAASLSSLPDVRSNDLLTDIDKSGLESGSGSLDHILSLLWQRYGLQEKSPLQGTHESNILQERPQESTDGSEEPATLLHRAYMDSFGSFRIKNEVIRLSTNFAEALPDFESLLLSISAAFNTVGPRKIQSLPNTSNTTISSKALVRLEDGEQSRFAVKFFRIAEAYSSDTSKRTAVPYWDPCLIRNVELYIVADGRILTPRSMPNKFSNEDPTAASEQSNGPFLHSSLARSATQRIGEVVIAGEPANFVVTLQNPFKFEGHIENLSLVTNEGLLKASPQSFTLEPKVVRKVRLQVTPTVPGELRISGCLVRMRGCRAQEFLIFPGPWTPKVNVKIKQVGLGFPDAIRRFESASLAQKDAAANLLLEGVPPQPSISAFTVIPSQPTLEVTKVSVPESGALILEGESKRLSIVLTNQSSTTPCDFLSITFRHKFENSAGASQNVPKVFTQRTPGSSESVLIGPGESMTFVFDVLGVPDVVAGSILFDYAYLSAPVVDTDRTFYTQQVNFQLQLSVIPTVQLLRLDTVPLLGDSTSLSTTFRAIMQSNLALSTKGEQDRKQADTMDVRKEQGNLQQRDIFVLLLELRNLLTRPLSVSFHLRPRRDSTDKTQNITSALLCDRYSIQAGQTARIALPLPKLQINQQQPNDTAHKGSSDYQQTSTHISENNEQIVRQALMEEIRGTWEDGSTNARGTVYLKGVALSPRMIEVISEHEMSLELEFAQESSEDSNPESCSAVGCNELLTLTAQITNRSSRPLKGGLKLHPCLAGAPDTGDIARHVAWTGAMWRELDMLEPGQQVRIRTGFSFSTPGRYETWASVMALSEDVGIEASAAASADSSIKSSQRPALLGQSVISILIRDI